MADKESQHDQVPAAATLGGGSVACPSTDLPVADRSALPANSSLWDATQTVGADGANGSEGSIRAKFPQTFRLTVGDVLGGRFLVTRFIANGGMGEVYEVEDRQLEGVHLALKTVLPRIADDPAAQKRFQREVLLARKVTHPALCPIYDIFHYQHRGEDLTFLTMKLVPGETLASRIERQGPLPLAEATQVAAQIGAALAAIHEQGILHRDIKTSNIMLDGAGDKVCACLMDFGLAHSAPAGGGGTSLTVGLAGTPAYMAPELFRGEPPSAASDIYALGVVLYQMLTGHLPKMGPGNELQTEGPPTQKPAIQKSSDQKPPSQEPRTDKSQNRKPQTTRDEQFQQLPAAWRQVLRSCLEADPSRRPQTVQSALGAVIPTYSSGLQQAVRAQLTRRHMLQLGLGASAALAGTLWLEWPKVDERFEQWRHPLPQKRFVALLDWPTPSDPRLKPMLSGIIDAIANELQRAEAFDRDLYIMAQKTATDLVTSAQVNELRESLGANLVLAATGIPHGKEFDLLLQVFDPATTQPLREKKIHVPPGQQQSLPQKAVKVAAAMLNIVGFEPNDRRVRPRTENPDALTAFQDAEALRKQPNDAGLDVAIEKYKQALDIDPHYAAAQARLAWAYLRSYGLHSDPAALALARENAEAAIKLDSDLVDAYVALAWAAHEGGDTELAADQIAKALALDPSNPLTLTYQANIYTANGEWAEAESTYKRLLALRPNYWLAHNELGYLLNSQGKYAQALVEFRAASLANPKNALALSNVAATYLALGKLPEALDNSEKSFALSPNDFAAILIAQIYRMQRDFPEAIAYGEKAVALAPAEAADWVELADCYSGSGAHRAAAAKDYEHAVKVLEEQLETEPKNGPAWMLLALCRTKAEHSETAMGLIAKAESFRADDIDSQLNKARTLELLGRRGEAISTLARCLQRGATIFQLQSLPDLEGLRQDPQYQKLVNANVLQGDLHS